MPVSDAPTYYRVRWPEADVPEDCPLWLHYEVSEAEDDVLRTIDIFADGRIERNSIEIEQRNGDDCKSLIDMSWREGATAVELRPMPKAEFEALWELGTDTPRWFVG